MPTLEMPPALAFMHQKPAWAFFQPPAWLWAQQQDFALCFPVLQPRLLCRGSLMAEGRGTHSRTGEEVLGAWSKVPVGILELLQAFVYGGLENWKIIH